jgi:hypothetical protein
MPRCLLDGEVVVLSLHFERLLCHFIQMACDVVMVGEPVIVLAG